MGILKHLLFWPVTGPLFLARFSLERVEGVVREQLTDDAAVKAELLELQLQLELGEIDDAAYAEREAALMQRLREVREWRERFGMGVSGGLVRVAVEEEVAPAGPSGGVPGQAPADGEKPEPASDVGKPEPPSEAEKPESPAEAGPRVADPGSASIEIHLDWD